MSRLQLIVFLAVALCSAAQSQDVVGTPKVQAGSATVIPPTTPTEAKNPNQISKPPPAQDPTVPIPQKLFSVTINVDETPHVIELYEGDSPLEVAVAFGAQHNLDAAMVDRIKQHIVTTAGGFAKRALFHYPFYVDIDNKPELMNLTVYEDSDPARLSAMIANKFGLPIEAAQKLKYEIEVRMVSMIAIRVNIDLGEVGGGKKALVVRYGESAGAAALRFGQDNGLTEQGINQLAGHIADQLRAIAAQNKKKAEEQAALDAAAEPVAKPTT